MSDPSPASPAHQHRRAAPERVPTAVVSVSDTRSLETDTAGARVVELLEQGGGLPEAISAVLLLEFFHAHDDGVEAQGVGPEHGATAILRPAVAVDPGHVDVAGPDGDALL